MSLNEEEQKQVTAYAELGAAIHFTLVELRNFEHLAEAQALEDQSKRAGTTSTTICLILNYPKRSSMEYRGDHDCRASLEEDGQEIAAELCTRRL